METITRPLLTVQQVAARTSLSVSSVRRKIAAGEIPAVQLGGQGRAIRVDPDELDRFLFGEQQ
jgi:excisionase family DNA binding protein